ncbi:HAD family hydrolase [Calidifontibacillus erzurumensis]|uniref:HAD-IA family hydrolase n=1 Tax=Calidifontibacillus erzurumensis TaxID=2741433 RepID=A0A8J8GC10_9BACI|nr:HAD-IA family hydrolase [Calidifontibacillus erzurumensis]NSL51034.1 HAD-IA family hydrolase [Calidifontibacillus erzurumensis]
MNFLGREINTVLFDKDGTILDFPSIWIPWVDDLSEYIRSNLPECSLTKKELRKVFGAGEEDNSIDPKSPLAIANMEESKIILAYKIYENGLPWDLAVFHANESVNYANERQNSSISIKLIDGIKELLEKFKENNVKLGVLTADDTEKAKCHLKKVGVENYFDFVIGSDQVLNGKPYPDLVYLASDRFGFSLSETMLIGDTNADIQLGKNAGINFTVGIVSYAKNTDHLIDADLIIHSYKELMDIGQ